jgi:hypothetical protein
VTDGFTLVEIDMQPEPLGWFSHAVAPSINGDEMLSMLLRFPFQVRFG